MSGGEYDAAARTSSDWRVSALDLGTMLRGCAAHGYRPVLYAETARTGAPVGELEWVCYPQNEVRAFRAFRGPDPVGVVRGLYLWSVEHPNVAPTFLHRPTSPLDQRTAACERACRDHEFGLACGCVLRGFRERNTAPRPQPAPAPSGGVHG